MSDNTNTQHAQADRQHTENPARPGWCACGRAYPCPETYTEAEQDEILSHITTMLRIRAARRRTH